MHKNQNQRKINSTITSGKTKIVYTQYYFWQSQNIVLLRRARVSPSFCVRKNSPDRSLKMSDCLKKKSWGDFLFSTCRTNHVRLSALRIADKKRELQHSLNIQHHQPQIIRQCHILRKHNINNHLPIHIIYLLR